MSTRRQPSEHFLRRIKGKDRQVRVLEEHPDGGQAESSLYKRVGQAAFRSLEVLALLFVIPTAYVLVVDLDDRQSQRTTQAWQLVTQKAPGNSGKGAAL